MNNLAALCAAHHGVVHRNDWTMTVAPDGTATFTRPDGSTLTSPPPRTRRPDRLPLHPPAASGATKRPPGAGNTGVTTEDTDPPGPPGPHTHPVTVTTTDRRGRPTTGTRGPATYTTTWDDTPPDQRTAEIHAAHRRAHDLPPPLTTAA